MRLGCEVAIILRVPLVCPIFIECPRAIHFSNQVPKTTESVSSNTHSRSEGPRLGAHPRASSERSSTNDLEAQIEDQSTGDNILPALFRRWGKYHYAGIAIVLLVLHIVRSVYSGFSGPDASGVSYNTSVYLIHY
jgi:hypothetical protein